MKKIKAVLITIALTLALVSAQGQAIPVVKKPPQESTANISIVDWFTDLFSF